MFFAEDIATTTGGVLHGAPTTWITEVSIDSRSYAGSDCLFVALRGPHFDGHQFIGHALQQGASVILADHHDPAWADAKAVIVVPDTLDALQAIAAAWRRRFDIPVIAITGSHGKTTVKDMLSSMLAQRWTVHRSPGSFNSQVGVALSLLGIRTDHDVAVIEAGISQVGEMQRLEAMIQPTAGILVGVGHAHIAGLKNLQTIAREKMQLFRNLSSGWVVLPTGSEHIRYEDCPGEVCTVGVETSDGTAPEATVALFGVIEEETGFRFSLRVDGLEHHDFQVPLVGRYHLQDAAAAIAAAHRHGADLDAMRTGMAGFHLGPRRMEMHTTASGVTLLNDAYNSDPTSARAALTTLAHYGGGRPTVAVLGDMLDLGKESAQRHRELGAIAAELGVSAVIAVGAQAAEVIGGARDAGMADEATVALRSLEEIREALSPHMAPGSVVLLKASRAMGLDRVAEVVLESVGPNRLLIDLDVLRENVRIIRRQIAPAELIAVVKGFAYGGDGVRISQSLVQQGVGALAVAFPDEAIALRQAGLRVEILVTNAVWSEADKIAKYDLTALVSCPSFVERLQEQAVRLKKRVRVHLEVDTGMRRLGIAPTDLVPFLGHVDDHDRIDITGVMTHFAAADDPQNDPFTARQQEAFRGAVKTLEAHGCRPRWIHTANTAALWRFDQSPCNAVRAGLGLYGYAPSPAVGAVARSHGIQRALTWTTRVIALREVEPGQSVGYARSWVAERATTIATIAVGYHDGFPRFMSNGGEVLVGGTRAPVVGHVCMDVSMVDVTDCADIAVGDVVVLFGAQGGDEITVDELATRGQTINYEILTRISPRVRRIFVRGD